MSFNRVKDLLLLIWLCVFIPAVGVAEMKMRREAQDELEAFHKAEIGLKLIELRGTVKCVEE